MPSSYRAVVHLFYFEDMSVEEVAQILGRKPSTVRTQLTRARRLLHKYFDED
ncbi:MAG: RNA polymerase sigma factor [Neglectibacter sp.]